MNVRVRGMVRLSAVIGIDGHICELRVISGHPLLITSAMSAVKQWVFEPTILGGEPVEVETCIDVMFHPR